MSRKDARMVRDQEEQRARDAARAPQRAPTLRLAGPRIEVLQP